MSGKSPIQPINPLAASLQRLAATGTTGFEGLVAKLLSQLTGLPFLPRRSGDQKGRDLDSDRRFPWLVLVECKRFRDSTALDARELEAEINLAVRDEPQLDLWVLATSRQMDANLSLGLEKTANDKAIDYLVLSCGTTAHPDKLDYLCAAFSGLVLTHCQSVAESTEALNDFLSEVGASQEFDDSVAKLASDLNGATVGFPSFRSTLNLSMAKTLANEHLSRGRLNASLRVHAASGLDIPRVQPTTSLHNFINRPVDNRVSLCVVHGEEGNGKTWLTAAWVEALIQGSDAPAVFWLTSTFCRDEVPLNELSRFANDSEVFRKEVNIRLKLRRWLSNTGPSNVVVVLDGINERHDTGFWSKYLLCLIGELEGHISIVVTCRTKTWFDDLAARLGVKASLVEVPAFNDEEFAQALIGHDSQTVARLWSLGPVARKPRYLADAIEYVKENGSSDGLTVERLYYEAWHRRTRTRTDYPLSSMTFEGLLRHLACAAQERIESRYVLEALPVRPESQDVIAELATGGVLRQVPGGFFVEELYLVEGLSLLLVDVMRSAVGTTSELRQRIAEWLGDTHRYPLTAKICASASYKSLLDHTLRKEVCAALILEFLNCQNASQESIDGILALASRRLGLMTELCEELWAASGVDSSVERAILKGLVELALDEQKNVALVAVLARWAGFIHEDGESRRPEPSERSNAVKERVKALAPGFGCVSLVSDGSIEITRVPNQRLLRLARLSLAVLSFADRCIFFPVILNMLSADAVMRGFRSEICTWAIASSRQPLILPILQAVDKLKASSTLNAEEMSRVSRVLLVSLESSAVESTLQEFSLPAPRHSVEENTFRALSSSSTAELPALLETQSIALRRRLEVARKFCCNPDIGYPVGFIDEVREMTRAFDTSRRRRSRMTSDHDLTWQLLEKVLCRADPHLYHEKVLEFARGVVSRDESAVFSWMFDADGYVRVFERAEVDALRQTWQTLMRNQRPDDEQWMALEITLFTMLLPFMSTLEQVQALAGRGKDAQKSISFSSGFARFGSHDEQVEIARFAQTSPAGMDAALWFACAQTSCEDDIWRPAVQSALASSSSVTRGLAMELLSNMQSESIALLIPNVPDVTADASAEERHYGTMLHLENGLGEASEIIARCDLAMCGHLLGFVPRPRADKLATAYTIHVLAWLEHRARPSPVPESDVPIAIRHPKNGDAPWATISVDWSNLDDSVRFTDEMATWGGLTDGGNDGAAFLAAFDSDKKHSELQRALTDALERAKQQKDWGYVALWSDETVRLLIASQQTFLMRVDKLLETAKSRNRLRLISPFIAAVTRTLILDGNSEAWRYFDTLGGKSGARRAVDSWSGNDLMEEAFFNAKPTAEAKQRWLVSLDSALSDAALLFFCEQLIAGGNQPWLRCLAEMELAAEVPYLRRRGLLLLAASEESDAVFDDVVSRTGSDSMGNLLKFARSYRERERWMQHWARKGIESITPIEARCAATLLLECADTRIWTIVASASRESAGGPSRDDFLSMLSRNDISNALKSNYKEEQKQLFGLRVLENDAWPWISW